MTAARAAELRKRRRAMQASWMVASRKADASTDAASGGRRVLRGLREAGVTPGDPPVDCDPEDFACGWVGGTHEDAMLRMRGAMRRLDRQVPHRIEADGSFTPDGRAGAAHPSSASLAPGGGRLLVTDTLGRVLEVATADGTCHREWKGYRGAQVAWATTSGGGQMRGALGDSGTRLSCEACPVTYVPKRRLLEVWAPSCSGT